MEETSAWTATSPAADLLTDAEFELADKIEQILAARAGEWLTPSRIARLAHAPLGRLRPVLDWMAVHQNGARHDGGSYGIRRFSSR
jgi:hypothetical protein